MSLQPLGDRILVERLEGRGVESVTPGGIIIPATSESKAQTTGDYFRARVIAVGPGRRNEKTGERTPVGLEPGEDVLVYSFADESGSGQGRRGLYTGLDAGKNRLFIVPSDVICAVGP